MSWEEAHMSAILLHSGKTEHFRALGETGQPVYHSALQLRKVISRRLPGMERHLAVPQRDQQGEGADWYSDIHGDVIPWRSATEGEREDARIQVEAFRQQVIALNQAPHDGQGGDHEVFSQLVKWVCHFPDENYVYLVDGTPVITFWGFIHPEADRHANPLLCLYPSSAPAQPAASVPASAPAIPTPKPAAEPAAEPAIHPVATTPRPWWRRWWWLLPLALALGLLLFGLRACTSSVNGPGLSTPSLNVGAPSASFPQSLWQGRDIWPFNRFGSGSMSTPNRTSRGLDGGLELPAFDGGLPEMGMPDMEMPGIAPPDGQRPDLAGLDETAPADMPELGAMPDVPGLPEGMAPPEIPIEGQPAAPVPGGLPEESGAAPPSLDPLTLPADAPNGAADFLDGNWRGAGVMDNQTGRPLQVTYVFDQGEGHMYIQRGGQSGMTCAGPVSAAMQGGQLHVEARQRARCEDGSHYEMPRVQCHQADGEVASCAASYDDEPFPMQLRKAS
ncbi:MAG: SrfA family protein [Pseudomonadota bacterium]